MSSHLGHHAIVIGGSIAGLLAARILADKFDQVTVVDRDRLPLTADPRRGVPQSVQPHVLFTKGYRILEELFPGIGEALHDAGAISFDWTRDFRYFQRGDWSEILEAPSGLESYTCTRPLLESTIRQRVDRLPNVQFLEQQRVVGLRGDRSRSCITGIELDHRGDLASKDLTAQLVVDASGRSTQAARWLQALGFTSPPATVINPDVGYATRRYRIPASADPSYKILLISHQPPSRTRLGYLAAVENGEWIATLGGYGQDYPPTDEPGFLEFAQSLPSPEFYNAICDAEPRSEMRVHRATANRLYHYEQIELPDGFVAIGDAVCALCPVYGQGMTVSAISSIVLRDWLVDRQKRRQQPSLNGASFQKRLARSNALPWSLATGFDSQFPTTKGAVSPKGIGKLFQGYANRLAERAHNDPDLHLQFIEMAHLMKPPTILLSPRVMLKALF
ncbi:monooxygenase [Leptolyngbya sp. FACHB-36]|uniref:FAD-dependent oxidoreductase n=1 Tax=Leptolyngbya sp. FACHB-36 TaxID=2692808 RepID=UPI00168082CC|nr:monooxygenase [Leptolyngbya sp. FACHB-36]MBD2018579.1 monooxygenase [Leptolyngbya sp. FACHB-36]